MLTDKIKTVLNTYIDKLVNDKSFEQHYRNIRHLESSNIGVRRRSAIKSALHEHYRHFNVPIRSLEGSYLERGVNSRFNLCPYGMDLRDKTGPSNSSNALEEVPRLIAVQGISQLEDDSNAAEVIPPVCAFTPNDLTGETTMFENTPTIEKVLMIKGKPAQQYNDMALVNELASIQAHIEYMTKHSNNSRKIEAMIKTAEQHKMLVLQELDSRE
jgi:hypothetical protein